MPRVRWEDAELPIRVFRVALRLSTHFLERVEEFQVPADSELRPIDLLKVIDQDLQITYQLLGDKPLDDYRDLVRTRLDASARVEGYRDVLGPMVTDLGAPFSCEKRLVQLNQRAFEELKRCIRRWGGPAAREREGQLKLLPLRCATAAVDDSPILSFVRAKGSLLLRAGLVKDALWECIILEFSIFHEYLSHYFPSWREDREEISEGYLFALEWEWFENEYLPFDVDLLQHIWNPRLRGNRHSLRFAQWLLRRCPASRDCAARFLLEWVAGWRKLPESLQDDVKSQLSGIANKLLSRMAPLRAKDEELQRRLDDAICGPCQEGNWDLKTVRDRLADALKAFGPPV